MADVLTIDDLIADKKHSNFFAEVVTGKTGGLSTGADIATATNQVTGQVQKTVPAIAQTVEDDFAARVAGMAFTRVGTFTAGATLTDMRQTLLWEVSQGGDGREYGWTGSFLPAGKVVPAGSSPTPVSAGNWVDRTEDRLRSDINVVQKRFNSVADMKIGIQLGDEGKLVEWVSYYYDGWAVSYSKIRGGNKGVVVAAGTGVADDGSLFDTNSGLQVRAIFDDDIYAEHFGLNVTNTNNEVCINKALMYIYNTTTNKTMSWDGATHNTKKGTLKIGIADTYTLSNEIYVPAGVSFDLGGSQLYQSNKDSHALNYKYDASLSYGYGNFFNGAFNGVLRGVGAGLSTKAGLYLDRSNHSLFSNLKIFGFKRGIAALEVQYSTFENIASQYNRIGWHISAHPDATNLTCIDNNYTNCVSNFNEYGVWLQTSSNSLFTRFDISRNSKVDVLIGKQLNGYISGYTISAGGSGYPVSSNIPLTITDATGRNAKAYAVTNSAGVVTSIVSVTSGIEYISPTIVVPGGTTLASITATVSTDSGIGDWDGQATLIRGQNVFDGLKVEHQSADKPISGYAIMVNGDNHHGDVFNDPVVSRQGTATSAYMKWAYLGGRSTTINNPIDPSALLDYYYCPSDGDYSIFTSHLAACGRVTFAPNHLALASFNGMARLDDGTIDGNNYLIQVMYRNSGLVTSSYYAVNQSTSSPVFRSRLASDAYDRLSITADGKMSLGSGSALPDVALSRGQADRLKLDAGDSFQLDGTWNGGRVIMNGYHFWVTAGGILRMKSSAPTSDTDGTVVGSQA